MVVGVELGFGLSVLELSDLELSDFGPSDLEPSDFELSDEEVLAAESLDALAPSLSFPPEEASPSCFPPLAGLLLPPLA